MFKVVLLGTGGPRPDPRRNATTTLIRLGEENILFDAGRGEVLQAVKAGVPLDTLGPVFITHHHYDHIGDLYDVMLATWMHGRKGPLHIYGPPDTLRISDAMLTQVFDKDWQWRSMGEPAFGGWKPVIVEDVSPGPVLDTGRWRVSADVVEHGNGLGFPDAFLRRWTCYGYRFEAQGKVVAISGDTVDCAGLRRIAQGADVLVQCCYMATAEIKNEHFRRVAQYTLAAGDSVGKIAAQAGVKTLVLTHHLPRKADSALGLLAEEVARDFSGRIVIGADLTEIAVA
jgi:ribonuclease BN (tRNA processing enzyme)